MIQAKDNSIESLGNQTPSLNLGNYLKSIATKLVREKQIKQVVEIMKRRIKEWEENEGQKSSGSSDIKGKGKHTNCEYCKEACSCFS